MPQRFRCPDAGRCLSREVVDASNVASEISNVLAPVMMFYRRQERRRDARPTTTDRGTPSA
jgi:hypothetical protein